MDIDQRPGGEHDEVLVREETRVPRPAGAPAVAAFPRESLPRANLVLRVRPHRQLVLCGSPRLAMRPPGLSAARELAQVGRSVGEVMVGVDDQDQNIAPGPPAGARRRAARGPERLLRRPESRTRSRNTARMRGSTSAGVKRAPNSPTARASRSEKYPRTGARTSAGDLPLAQVQRAPTTSSGFLPLGAGTALSHPPRT